MYWKSTFFEMHPRDLFAFEDGGERINYHPKNMNYWKRAVKQWVKMSEVEKDAFILFSLACEPKMTTWWSQFKLDRELIENSVDFVNSCTRGCKTDEEWLKKIKEEG